MSTPLLYVCTTSTVVHLNFLSFSLNKLMLNTISKCNSTAQTLSIFLRILHTFTQLFLYTFIFVVHQLHSSYRPFSSREIKIICCPPSWCTSYYRTVWAKQSFWLLLYVHSTKWLWVLVLFFFSGH